MTLEDFLSAAQFLLVFFAPLLVWIYQFCLLGSQPLVQIFLVIDFSQQFLVFLKSYCVILLQFGTYSRVLSHFLHANGQVFFQPAQLPFLLCVLLFHFPPLNISSLDQFLQLTPNFFLVLRPILQSQNFLLHSTNNTHVLLMFALFQRHLLTFDISCRLYFLSQICNLIPITLVVLLDQPHLPHELLTLLQQRSMRLKGLGQMVKNLLKCFLGVVLVRIDYRQQFLIDFP